MVVWRVLGGVSISQVRLLLDLKHLWLRPELLVAWSYGTVEKSAQAAGTARETLLGRLPLIIVGRLLTMEEHRLVLLNLLADVASTGWQWQDIAARKGTVVDTIVAEH